MDEIAVAEPNYRVHLKSISNARSDVPKLEMRHVTLIFYLIQTLIVLSLEQKSKNGLLLDLASELTDFGTDSILCFPMMSPISK